MGSHSSIPLHSSLPLASSCSGCSKGGQCGSVGHSSIAMQLARRQQPRRQNVQHATVCMDGWPVQHARVCCLDASPLQGHAAEMASLFSTTCSGLHRVSAWMARLFKDVLYNIVAKGILHQLDRLVHHFHDHLDNMKNQSPTCNMEEDRSRPHCGGGQLRGLHTGPVRGVSAKSWASKAYIIKGVKGVIQGRVSRA